MNLDDELKLTRDLTDFSLLSLSLSNYLIVFVFWHENWMKILLCSISFYFHNFFLVWDT